MGRHQSSAVLKLLNGSAQHDSGLVRDDVRVRPKDKTPHLPPWEKLTADEQTVFDYLVKEFVMPAVHGRPDGIMIAALAREIVQSERSLAKLKEFGPVMKHPKTGKPGLQPYFYSYHKHNEAVRKLMFELGFSPLGRLKHAPPMGSSPSGASLWDDID